MSNTAAAWSLLPSLVADSLDSDQSLGYDPQVKSKFSKFFKQLQQTKKRFQSLKATDYQ
jgi:hypothetical protein